MKEYKYRFTIFTPCFNSEKFLSRVFNSVSSQIFRDFEWLVIDDASNDSTSKMIEDYQVKANFPIRVITNTENKMLYYNYNLAFDEAQGEFMIFAGHDDEFDSNTLERFNQVWEDYGNNDIAGIWCRCRDQHGNIIGSEFPKYIIISDYHSLFEKYIYGSQERFGCTKTEVLKQNKFDLINHRTIESFLWSDIGIKFKTIYINDVLRTYFIEPSNEDSLTNRSRKKIAKETYVYYIDFLNIYSKKVPNAFLLKLRYHFATSFYGFLCGKNGFQVLSEIRCKRSKALVLIMIPFSFILSKIKS